MAQRFTNTEKWDDPWFSRLKPLEMLLFNYLCDKCDVAGFITVNHKRWSNDLNLSNNRTKSLLDGLKEKIAFSENSEIIWIKNFIKQQKNLPLNYSNNAHKGILSRIQSYENIFDKSTFNKIINEKELRGLLAPLGKGKGKGKEGGVGETNTSIKIDF